MKKLFLYILIGFCCTGCGSSKITNRWKADIVPAREMKKIMVVGIIHEKDRSLRAQMERHITADLRVLGYDAFSSMEVYGPESFSQMDEKEVISKLHYDSVDAVLTVVLLNKEKEKYYVPGHFYYSPYALYYDRYYPYHLAIYNRIYEEGYYVTNTHYFWESNLYMLGDQRLLYSVQTNSSDPATIRSMAHNYGRILVQDMVREGVLKDRNCCNP